MEGEAAELNPEIELVPRPSTAEALKEIEADVNREARLFNCADVGRTERAGPAPLRATLDDGLIAEEFQHAADSDLAADDRVVELAHDLRLLVLRLLAAACGPLAAAFCSARWARYDLPLKRWMIAPSTTRSSKAIARGGSPR